MKLTLSGIKADIGSIGGHTKPSKEVFETVREEIVKKGIESGKIDDAYFGFTGDDIHMLLSHKWGLGNKDVHRLAWDAFKKGAEVASAQGLYGAGQDLLKDSFSGNIKGLGPGVAEMEFEARENEAVALFTADKTEPGAFNYPFYRLFCEPSANTGLLVNKALSEGVIIVVMDVETGKKAEFKTPEDIFLVGGTLMYPGRYVIDSVKSQGGEPILAATTDRLHNIAGTYVGKDDPLCIVRLQKDFPATEEACSVFKTVHYVAGDTRGSHHMPLMPVKNNSPASSNFCMPIISCTLFSIKNGKITARMDGFETVDWDYYRSKAVQKAEFMREQGFVHPATLVPEELEYSNGYKALMSKVNGRFR